MHRERGALESAAFKISPYKLGGRPLQSLRPGVMAPLPPPLGTPLGDDKSLYPFFNKDYIDHSHYLFKVFLFL